MNNISSVLLSDTLKLIQLARETARVQGQPEQAEKLKPVVDQLKSLAEGTNQAKAAIAAQKTTIESISPSGGILAQEDFRTLLSAVQKSQHQNTSNLPAGLRPTSSLDRNQMVVSMASGGMSALDIARQMGMTLDEVNMVIGLNQKSSENRKEISA